MSEKEFIEARDYFARLLDFCDGDPDEMKTAIKGVTYADFTMPDEEETEPRSLMELSPPSFASRAQAVRLCRENGQNIFHAEKVDVLLGRIAELERENKQARAQGEAWRTALTDAAVIDWVLNDENASDPQKMLSDIIRASVMQALDPAISQDAQKLVAQGFEAARDTIATRYEKRTAEQKTQWNAFVQEDKGRSSATSFHLFWEAVAAEIRAMQMGGLQ